MPATDPVDTPHLEDKRPTIAGLLPKNTQRFVLVGIAGLMILVILFSGHNTPKPKATTATPPITVNESSQAHIQDYRSRIEDQMRKLANEEAQLAQTQQAMGVRSNEPSAPLPPNSRMVPPSYSVSNPVNADPERDWIERDREKRAYQSLFASNIALTYRRETTEDAALNPAKGAPRVASQDSSNPTPEAATDPKFQYHLFEGTMLETVLTNRLDSSFSGPVNCMVTINVYSFDGQHLLIPQGSRVLGEVRKLESFGEQRLAVSFHRLIMPDGFSVSLDQFKGLDQIGETGLRDRVNHHYLQVFGVSIALGALAGLGQSNTRYSRDESAAAAYQQGVASSVSQSAMHVLDRYLNVLPTFTIREGYRIKIYLSQDLMLPAAEAHPVRNDL